MSLATELEASLKEFLTAGLVDLHENGARTSFGSGVSWEVRGDGEKPLLHLWAERFDVTRRLLAITDHSEQRLVLAVERFGRAKPDRLEFVRREFERGSRELSSEEFCEQLRTLLAEQFPDDTVESLTISADLEHSLSGNYARGLLRRGSSRYAVLAAPASESADTIDNCLTFALLWLSTVRLSQAGRTIAGLRIILPKNTARTVAHRFGALDHRLNIDLYEHEPVLNVLGRHELYRAQPERWLESLVREDVTRVDAVLDPRFVYSQVFASSAGERRILDLLTVTRSSRLTIIELKASEHIHLPLQAADYWLRVKKHLERGEISRYGYFPGIELQQIPALVYFVAPALRFHPSTDELLRFLSPELEVVRVGLAESWRRGLRVVTRQ